VDSGSSVGESVFLERVRQWLHASLKERATQFSQPTVWIVYPNRVHGRHYGVYPVNEYDKWEIRPVRRRNRALDPAGMLATVAMFEEGCFRKKIKAPWREWNEKQRRANVVFLNPSRVDIHWGAKNHEKFKKVWNVPRLAVGPPLRFGMPVNTAEWIDSIWSFSDRGVKVARESMWSQFADRLPWEKLWEKRPAGQKTAFLAHEWGDAGTLRYPELAKQWVPRSVQTYTCQNSRSGADLLRATGCDLYIIASAAEAVPFDAMIAAARGATIIAPDRPIYRWLPGRKILFPCHDGGGGRIIWNNTDVALTIQHRLKHELGTTS
jgi:hypothetical protein